MAEETPGTETDPTVTEEKKSRGMLTIIVVGLVMLLAGGGAAWFFLSGDNEETAEVEEGPDALVFLGLDNFLVNLANTEGRHYLRVGIDLGLEHEVEADAEEFELLIALVRDTILLVLGTWESEALLTPEGKGDLKEDILQALDERLPELGVSEVYFNDFLVQR